MPPLPVEARPAQRVEEHEHAQVVGHIAHSGGGAGDANQLAVTAQRRKQRGPHGKEDRDANNEF